MRLIVCTLLWNFDLELCEESKSWSGFEVGDGVQKAYGLWDKPDLMVRLTERKTVEE